MANQPEQTGAAMGPMWPVILVFVGLLATMAFAFEYLIDRRENPNASLVTSANASTRVVLKRNRSGAYIAPGLINGQPVTLMVDTGASTVALPAQVAEALGLERGVTTRSHTAGGITRSYDTWIASVQIGGIRVENIRGSIVPAMGGNEVLLGMTVLRHLDFSQQGDRLVLELPGGG